MTPFIVGLCLLPLVFYLTWKLDIRFQKKIPQENLTIQSEQLLKRSDLNKLEYKVNDLPRQVLDSITGSTSQHKGKLAELIAYIDLKAQYDRLIPLNSIVDFICIRFPKEGQPGAVVFLDIKNGKAARLSEDQKMLKSIIEAGQIEFLKIRIDTTDVLKELDESNTPTDTAV